MPRVLAVADEVDPALSPQAISEIAPDLVLSCGDLPFDHLEFLVTAANVPLLFVPGNHDPSLARGAELLTPLPFSLPELREPPGPRGCTNVDGRIEDAAGLRVAGLGGSVRYREGPHQYTQREMGRRARRIRRRAATRRLRDGHGVDVLLTHSPPRGSGDEEEDPVHHGFQAFVGLVERLRPKILLHGHVHPYGVGRPDRMLGATRVVNVIPHRLLEIEP